MTKWEEKNHNWVLSDPRTSTSTLHWNPLNPLNYSTTTLVLRGEMTRP